MKFFKTFNDAVDRFCARHPRFGLPNLMLYIILGNILVFFISMMDTTGAFLGYLCLSPSLILRGQLWRLITFVFVPETYGILSLALFLYFYYFIGSSLQREWGSGRFLFYYLSGMVLTIIYSFAAAPFYPGNVVFSGARFINMSMFFAFATLYPDQIVMLFFIIPVKVKWLAYLDAAYFLLSIIIGRTLLPLMPILNYFLFCAPVLAPAFASFKRRNSKKVIDFQRAARQAKYQQEHAPYRHKCAVCGRTDTDHPDLEFRYCSRCAGYHCFCSDHIDNHVHFSE